MLAIPASTPVPRRPPAGARAAALVRCAATPSTAPNHRQFNRLRSERRRNCNEFSIAGTQVSSSLRLRSSSLLRVEPVTSVPSVDTVDTVTDTVISPSASMPPNRRGYSSPDLHAPWRAPPAARYLARRRRADARAASRATSLTPHRRRPTAAARSPAHPRRATPSPRLPLRQPRPASSSTRHRPEPRRWHAGRGS